MPYPYAEAPAFHLKRRILIATAFSLLISSGAQAEEYLPASRYGHSSQAIAQHRQPLYPTYIHSPRTYPAQPSPVTPAPQTAQPYSAPPPMPKEKESAVTPATKGWTYKVGAGVMYRPAYEGSDNFDVTPFPNISVDYKNSLFFANIFDGIGSYPIQSDQYKLGASVGVAFGRDQDDDRKNLRGMGDIDPSPTANLLGEYSFGLVRLSGKFSQGTDEYGMTAEADIGTFLPVTPDLVLAGNFGTVWANSDHMNSYFGVSPPQSVRSDYTAYEAESGFKSVGINASAFYSVTENIDMMLVTGVDYLLGDAADSPLTKEELQPSILIGTSYQF